MAKAAPNFAKPKAPPGTNIPGGADSDEKPAAPTPPAPSLFRILRETAPGLPILLLASFALLALAWIGATRAHDPDAEAPFWAARAETGLTLPYPLTSQWGTLRPSPLPGYALGASAFAVDAKDGQIIAVGEEGRVAHWNGEIWRETTLPTAAAFDVQFTDDLQFAVIADIDGALTMLRLGDFAGVRRIVSGGALYSVVIPGLINAVGFDIYAGGAKDVLVPVSSRDFDFEQAFGGDSARGGASVLTSPVDIEQTDNEVSQKSSERPSVNAADLQAILNGSLPPTIQLVALEEKEKLLIVSKGGLYAVRPDRGGVYSLLQLIQRPNALGIHAVASRGGDYVAAVSLAGGTSYFSPHSPTPSIAPPRSKPDVLGPPLYAVAATPESGLVATGGAEGLLWTRVTDRGWGYRNDAPIHDIAILERPDQDALAADIISVDKSGAILRLQLSTLNYLPPPWAIAAAFLGLAGLGLFLFLTSRARRNIHADDIRLANVAAAPIAAFLDSDGPLTDPRNAGRALNALTARLADFMLTPATAAPVTFALTGEWGSGKSSAMRLLERRLRSAHYPCVWFNAWHHQKEEHLFASLMAEVRGQATPGIATLAFWLPRNLLVRARLFIKRLRNRSLRYYVVTFAMAFIGAMALYAGPNIAEAAPAAGAFKILGVIGPAAYFLWVALDALKPFKINPAVLLTSTRSLLRGGPANARLGFRDSFASGFRELTEALGARRLTIFIDDLDRCRKDQVVEVLEAVNFLVSSGQCYVVLGISEQPVKNAIGLVFSDLAKASAALDHGEADGDDERKAAENRSNFAERYLEKLINLKVAIPPFDGDALTDWLARAHVAPRPLTRWRRWRSALLSPPVWIRDGALVAGLAFMLGFGVNTAVWVEEEKCVSCWLASFAEPEEPEASPVVADAVSTASEVAEEQSPPDDDDERLAAALAQLYPPGAPDAVASAPPVEASPTFADNLADPFTALGLMAGFMLGAAGCFAFPSSRFWLGKAAPEENPRDDVDAFSAAMADVLPHIYETLGSPRAIKRFVNRMRFLTAGISNADGARIRKIVSYGALEACDPFDAASGRFSLDWNIFDLEQSVSIARDNSMRASDILYGLFPDFRFNAEDWDDYRQLNAGVQFSTHGEATSDIAPKKAPEAPPA